MVNKELQALNHQKKEELWAERIQQCRDSGLGVQAWCAKQGLSCHTYYKWQQKLSHRNARESETGFFEVNLSSNNMPALTVHIGAYSADVFNGAEELTIASVLRVLKTC